MQEDRNQSQIIRKDAKNCFVESLSDAFDKGKAHFAFATYDVNKPTGQRQTNNVHIYISMPELLELCSLFLGCAWTQGVAALALPPRAQG